MAVVDEGPEVQRIVVGGLDYTFEMDESAPPGAAEIHFDNRGEVDHELVLVRLRPGATMADFAAAMSAGENPRGLTDGIGGILIAGPGQTSFGSLNVEFEVGRTYMLVCNFTDTPEAPPHFELGMVRAFTVEEPAA
ncbi:MAG TPA: hypothetical protein VK858_18720 [Longimicrobiales bacterium]|nr:hypothetical protein [Longimicrobiales bacterium]